MIKNICIIFGLIVFLAASPALAQWKATPGGRNFPLSDSPCWTKPYLEATPEQLKSLENLQRSYYKEFSVLRNQQINLRYKLRSFMDHTKPDARMILEIQNQFSGIQEKLDKISIQYFLKAKALFTPDQLSSLPSGCSLGFNYGQGMGWGQMKGRGKRY